MIYDVLKILKKIVMFWYVYVLTVVLGFSLYLFLPRNQTIINYTYSSEFRIEIFNNNNVEYYNFAQKQVLKNLILDESKIKENLEAEINKDFKLAQTDVNILRLTVTSKSKDACKTDYQAIKDEICNYIKNNLLEGYSNTKAEISTDQIGSESESANAIKRDFSKLFKAFILVAFAEVVGFGIWGTIDDKIISSKELKFKFNKNVIVENKQNDEEFYKFKIKQFEKENKKVSVLKNVNDSDALSSFKAKEEVLTADVVLIEVSLDKTSERKLAKIVEFLDNNNKKEVYFVVDKNYKEVKVENTSNK